MKIWKNNFFLSLAKQILDPAPDPDPDQLEKLDPDPHQNVLDPPHWVKLTTLPATLQS